MKKSIWQELEELYREFQKLGISQSIDYEKYYLYSLIAHSTAIEGSTLTEMEAQLLFDEGLTANGRTARLLMNNIQFTYNLFPAKIFKEYCKAI